jgi:UDPglucose 6-dehydrogenase
MKIAVFGTGYVGLVQGAVLADAGHTVICVDIDENKLARLRKGEIPIFEPGLEPIVKSNFAEGRLLFTSDAKSAVEQSNVQFIAVGTPPDEDGSADLKYVLAVAKTIATHMTGYTVIVDKSTVPVGTADKVTAMVAQTLKERGVSFEFDVVSNPEFLKEGAAVADCQRPDRIVIGTESAKAEKILR